VWYICWVNTHKARCHGAMQCLLIVLYVVRHRRIAKLTVVNFRRWNHDSSNTNCISFYLHVRWDGRRACPLRDLSPGLPARMSEHASERLTAQLTNLVRHWSLWIGHTQILQHARVLIRTVEFSQEGHVTYPRSRLRWRRPRRPTVVWPRFQHRKSSATAPRSGRWCNNYR